MARKRIGAERFHGSRSAVVVAARRLALLARIQRHWLHAPIATLTQPVTLDVPPARRYAPSRDTRYARPGGRRGVVRACTCRRPAPKIKAGEYEIPPGQHRQMLLRAARGRRVVLERSHPHRRLDLRRTCAARSRRIPRSQSTLKGLTTRRSWRHRPAASIRKAASFRTPIAFRAAPPIASCCCWRIAGSRRSRPPGARRGPAARDALRGAHPGLDRREGNRAAQRAAAHRRRVRHAAAQGMRLQTDPTVIYGIGPAYDGNIPARDLRTTRPTTPTRAPDCRRRRSRCHGAKRSRPPCARETGDIFFVATGLGDGRHFFAETLEAHNVERSRYLANLRGGRGVQVH